MEKGKCDMCGDEKEVRCLEDKDLGLILYACEDCVIYAFESVGFPRKEDE